MVICLERGADLHIAQLMPLPLTIYWSKRQWVAVASTSPYANLHLASVR